jgi:hypothetical protein
MPTSRRFQTSAVARGCVALSPQRDPGGVSVAIGVGAIVGDAFAAVERPALSKRVVPAAEARLESLLQA